jgi:hypothetical protein
VPLLGETQKGLEIGYRSNGNFMWTACTSCGKERWVQLKWGKPYYGTCNSCRKGMRGALNPRWKGGRHKDPSGYIAVYVEPSDFFHSMISRGNYVPEHRLVMAKRLNRCLLSWEVVHHKNGIRNDNRLENLELLSANSRHNKILNKEIKRLRREVGQLQQRVTLLEAENVMLKTPNLYS